MNVITNRQASDAITTAMARLEFLVAALQQEDLTLDGCRVEGLAAILQDVNTALELPSNHLHELVLIDVHGPREAKRAPATEVQ